MAGSLFIDGVKVGGGRTYIIAEAGSNHNGDIAMAKHLIEAAAAAGADAIKFQAFQAKEHYSRYTPSFTYLKEQGSSQSTYDLIHSLEIDRDWHRPLMDYAKACGITFLSSPCDFAAIDQLGEMGMAAFKLASFDLPDVTLVKRMAAFGKPLILSTGLADYADIQAAVRACREAANDQIVLLQCTSLYPAPANLSNLRAMQTMTDAFGCVCGYSDHTLGDHVAIAAVALGAKMIEKHFTLDRSLPGPDHCFAIEPAELKAMIQRVRDVESALGDGIKDGPREEEREMFEKGRRSIHARRKISAGEAIRREDLCVKRPGYGLSPLLLDNLVGMAPKRDIDEDRWISWEDFK